MSTRHFATCHIALDDLTICYLHFPPFPCPFAGHSPNRFSDPLQCCFACWIPVSCHNFLGLCLMIMIQCSVQSIPILTPVVMCLGLWTGFGLVIGFTDHFRIVTTSNYKSRGITHSKCHCNYSTHKVFSSHPDFQLPPGLKVISYQPPSLLFTA
jgi:hypothetical protein